MKPLGVVLLLSTLGTLPLRSQSLWLGGEPGVEHFTRGVEISSQDSGEGWGVGWRVGGIAGGLAAGAVGFFGGLYVGGLLAEDCGEDLACMLQGIGVGAAVGEALLLPLGVHLGSGRRGSIGLKIASSVALGGLGVAAVALTNAFAAWIPVPVLQLVVGLAVFSK